MTLQEELKMWKEIAAKYDDCPIGVLSTGRAGLYSERENRNKLWILKGWAREQLLKKDMQVISPKTKWHLVFWNGSDFEFKPDVYETESQALIAGLKAGE